MPCACTCRHGLKLINEMENFIFVSFSLTNKQRRKKNGRWVFEQARHKPCLESLNIARLEIWDLGRCIVQAR